MGTVQTGIFSSKEEQEKFDSWTKEEIYEAYLAENQARVMLNKEVNKLKRKLAEVRYTVSN